MDWVQCDGGCEKWFHLHCVGLSKDSLKDDEDYYCTICSGSNDQAVKACSDDDASPNTTVKGLNSSAVKCENSDEKDVKLESKIMNGDNINSSNISSAIENVSRIDDSFKMDILEEQKVKNETDSQSDDV